MQVFSTTKRIRHNGEIYAVTFGTSGPGAVVVQSKTCQRQFILTAKRRVGTNCLACEAVKHFLEILQKEKGGSR